MRERSSSAGSSSRAGSTSMFWLFMSCLLVVFAGLAGHDEAVALAGPGPPSTLHVGNFAAHLLIIHHQVAGWNINSFFRHRRGHQHVDVATGESVQYASLISSCYHFASSLMACDDSRLEVLQ